MNIYLFIASAIVIATHFPLWKQISGRKVNQNLLSFILWGTIDLLTGIEIIFERGNFVLAIIYAFGSFVTAVFIFNAKNKSKWTWFESLVVSLVFLSMAIWYFSGTRTAIIASTTAMFISGIPQLLDAYKKPREMPFLVYLSYLVANCFSVAGGKNWSVEEEFFSVVATILCFLIVICVFRKFWIEKTFVQKENQT